MPRDTVPGNSAAGLSGWYTGGQFGFSHGTATSTSSDPSVVRSTTGFGRIDGGLHAGYNDVLSSRLVLGVEADVSFPNFLEDGAVSSKTTPDGTNVTEQIDFVSTLRGRLGYAIGRGLFYGTGGLAPSETRFTESSASFNHQIARWRLGWAIGAGAAMPVAPGWSARVEYLYSRLGQTGATFPSGTSVESKADVGSLRFGLSRMLDWPSSNTRPSGIGRGHPRVAELDASVSGNRGGNGEDGEGGEGGEGGDLGEGMVGVNTASAQWNVHGQATYVEQGYFGFPSPYEGVNSLSGSNQIRNTLSGTGFLGLRLWHGAELYFNPEIDQGFGLSTTHGVAAFPNGEAQKAAFAMPRFVVDRLFIQQRVGLGGEQETLLDGPNQLAGTRDISRVTFVVGRLAVTDYFNQNLYANDPRVNFLNWNIYGAGAYDWTMDQISWTWGALADLNQKNWALRFGYFLLPTVSSTNTYDMHIPEHGEYAAELEERYSLGSQPGTLRVFGWVNHGTMGGYSAALAMPTTTPGYPNITLTREVRTNPGLVINVQQAISGDIGLFSRASWSPGLVEILGGTDCSRSLSLGGVLGGIRWGRPDDHIGLSGVVGGLSPEARAYFAAGGLGILIGDGALSYRTEKVLEAYYALALEKWATISFDYQFVSNPGYNADRGPVSIYGLRIHTAF